MSHWRQFAGVPKIPKDPTPKTPRYFVERCCAEHDYWWVTNRRLNAIDSTHSTKEQAETAAAALNAAGP